MIKLQPTDELSNSAQITFNNMQSYYEEYDVNWDVKDIEEQIRPLENWDIVNDGQIIGALRLSYDGAVCLLRDIQIVPTCQNKGYGRYAMMCAFELALNANANKVTLKVFKISPAVQLYMALGFEVEREDDRFYYMSLALSAS